MRWTLLAPANGGNRVGLDDNEKRNERLTEAVATAGVERSTNANLPSQSNSTKHLLNTAEIVRQLCEQAALSCCAQRCAQAASKRPQSAYT
jgi:hypothetical protein